MTPLKFFAWARDARWRCISSYWDALGMDHDTVRVSGWGPGCARALCFGLPGRQGNRS